MKLLLFLIGFMGSGKSTLGHYLAREWDLPLWDSDHLLEVWQGDSPGNQLHADPVAFRAREQILLGELARLKRGIIVLGGGVVESENNRNLLQSLPVLLLDPGPDICWHRVQTSSQYRPLAVDKESFYALYNRRQELYRQCCLWQLQVDAPIENLAETIEKFIV
ncbi:MAG: hypothetical protein FH749_05500 [Firmicutes bacterium]|nr:hypothetical protein [Bacillota bacterium]